MDTAFPGGRNGAGKGCNVKNDSFSEPKDADKLKRMKPKGASGRTEKGKRLRLEDSQQIKERQSSKLKELSDALVAAGFASLDEQAMALGLSRSTTWTILKAKHKNYGLSGALISRILQRPGLNRSVRAKLIEYVREKASGLYGHNKVQLRRFKERLSVREYGMLNITPKLAEPAPKKHRTGSHA